MWRIILILALTTEARAATRIAVNPAAPRQTFDGMGCGTIFYSGHITSLAQRNKKKLQEQLYDDLFTEVNTHFLHLMIRPDFEPNNDNEDPYRAAFSKEAFKSNESAIAVSQAALARRPDMQLFATLYTPPSWMKTNEKPGGGGKERATLKPGLALELGEYIWAYLQHMHAEGVPVHYLSICNESDWEHSQPSYFLDADRHAALFRVLAEYLDAMATRYPDVPRPKLVAPNTLSAVDVAKQYWPALKKAEALKYVDVLGTHDYDRRGHRWKTLRELAGERPVWCTEWCWNGKDTSPDLIRAASEFWLVMTEAFNDGANVWMAYDWAYPPRDGGEALAHIKWGQSYHKTKIYHAFRQWCNPLIPGMRIVDCTVTGPGATGISAPGVKSSAFLDAKTGHLVIHIVNLQDSAANIATHISSASYQVKKIIRTSTVDAEKLYPARPLVDGTLTDTLTPREMVTYILQGS